MSGRIEYICKEEGLNLDSEVFIYNGIEAYPIYFNAQLVLLSMLEYQFETMVKANVTPFCRLFQL